MKLKIDKVAELVSSITASVFIVDAAFLGGGFQSSIQGVLWLIVAWLAGISQKLD